MSQSQKMTPTRFAMGRRMIRAVERNARIAADLARLLREARSPEPLSTKPSAGSPQIRLIR